MHPHCPYHHDKGPKKNKPADDGGEKKHIVISLVVCDIKCVTWGLSGEKKSY